MNIGDRFIKQTLHLNQRIGHARGLGSLRSRSSFLLDSFSSNAWVTSMLGPGFKRL